MRMIAIFTASILLLLGCGAKSHKTSPHPLAKNAVFALYVVSATSSAITQTDTDPVDGTEIYLTTPAVLTSTDVASVQLVEDTPSDPPQPGGRSLLVRLMPRGATKLAAAMATPKGMRLAIVINDKVVAAPQIFSTLSNECLIAGDKTESFFELLTKE